MKWAGASATPQVSGLDELQGKSNYLLGNRPDNWKSQVPAFGRVLYRDLYPGVDLIYYGNQGNLEYDLAVAPGADPATIRLRLDGSESIRPDADGSLEIKVGAGELTLHKPVIYQTNPDGTRQLVDGNYVVHGRHSVSFRIAAYNRSRTLIIDPQLTYSSFLGGSGNDNGWKVAVDSNHDAVIVGSTQSVNFPLVNPRQPSNSGGSDVFVARINPEAVGAASLTYASYLGGSANDFGRGVAIDASGQVYVAGDTSSANFPVTTGAYQAQCSKQGNSCSSDAFVAKLDPTGSTLLYSTYIGGTGSEFGFAVAVDSSGQIIVAGPTSSSNFPVTTGAFQTTYAGGSGNFGDAFVAEVNPAGMGTADLVYATYLGGSGSEQPWAVAVDSVGGIYVGGSTTSGNFPVTAGAFSQSNSGAGGLGLGDAFVSKLNPGGQGTADLVYSTFLGGAGDDRVEGIAVDSSGLIYVTGFTQSSGFPVTAANAFQSSFGGGSSDVFVSKLDPSMFGSPTLVYSTFFGGSSFDLGHAIALDSNGLVYVTGETASLNLPLVNPIQATCDNGCTPSPLDDVFIAQFDLTQTGTAGLLFSTYLGGRDVDTGWGIAVDSLGSAYVTGQIFSTDFPTLIPYQASCNNCSSFIGSSPSGDGFLVKVCITNCPAVSLPSGTVSFGSQDVSSMSQPQTVTLTNSGSGDLVIASVTITGANQADFSQTNSCPVVLGAGQSCNFQVTFSPIASGSRSASLTIGVNIQGAAPSVPLSGTGVAIIPTVGLSPSGLTFAAQTTNTTSAAQPVTVTNQGPGTLTISSITITGTNFGDFGQTNNCPASLALNATCTINVTFTPTATGTRLGSVSIADNGTGSPQTVSLTGTGSAPVINPWPNGYAYEATFTVASGMVTATQANFPALISGAFADLKTTGNGGRIANTCTQTVGNNAITVPCDLIFTSDAAGASPVNWEFESYNSATGAVNIWVNVPSINSGSVIYGWYGNTAITALQTTPASTWSGNFLSVYHLEENPAGTAPQMNDSTTGTLNASAGSAVPAGQQAAGRIGGSINLNRSYDFLLGNASTWSFDLTDSFSVSCWCMTTSNNSGDIVAKQQNTGAVTGWEFFERVGTGNPTFALDLTNNATNNANRLAMLTPSFAQNTWHHVVATYSGGAAPSSVHIYVDGVDQPLTALANTLTGSIANTTQPEIGGRAGANSLGPGKIDEVRVYAKGVVLSPGWVTAEYNNQNNPATFFTVNTGLTNNGN